MGTYSNNTQAVKLFLHGYFWIMLIRFFGNNHLKILKSSISRNVVFVILVTNNVPWQFLLCKREPPIHNIIVRNFVNNFGILYLGAGLYKKNGFWCCSYGQASPWKWTNPLHPASSHCCSLELIASRYGLFAALTRGGDKGSKRRGLKGNFRKRE